MTSGSAPRVMRPADATFAPRFAYGDQAQVAEVSGTGDGTPLGTGFVRLTNAAIPWTIQYDEVLLVVEGAVTVRCGDRALHANVGEAIWLPAQTELVYEAASALVFYAIHPANWADG